MSALSSPYLAPRDFWTAVCFGLVPGYSRVSVLGSSAASAVGADVWPANVAYPFLAASTALEVVSSSANDAAAGTGARTVQVTGLDGSYNVVTQSVTLNGLAAVALPTPLFRINRMIVTSAGTGLTNAGNITVRDVATATARCIALAADGQSRQAVYTVPAGYSMLMVQQYLGINSPKSVDDVSAANVVTIGGVQFHRFEVGVNGAASPFFNEERLPLLLAEKSDITMRVIAQSGVLNLTGGFVGLLRSNTAAG